MKRSNLWKLKITLVPLLLFPYIVAFSPNPDSSYTTLEFAVGKGSYARVSRDCSGNVLSVNDIPFEDAGVSVDHHFSSFRVGAKAGIANNGARKIFNMAEHSFRYIDPNVGLNTKSFGLDLGALFYGPRYRNSTGASVFPTGALRLGKSDGTYFSFSLANNLPLMTGGGIVDVGIGFNLGRPNSSLWLGVGALPYDGAVISAKGDIPLSDKVLLNLRGQIGDRESLEYALSVGTKIRF